MNQQTRPPVSARPDDAELAGQHPALAELLAGGPPSDARIGEFLSDNDAPLIETGAATFFFHGEAEKVDLLRWIGGGVDRLSFRRVEGTALWILRIDVEDGGRFEYKLNIQRNGHEDWILDPNNRYRANDPFGENSVCRTWGYRRPDWSRPAAAPIGRIETVRIDSPTFGTSRTEKVYLPAGYAPGHPHPLVVIHDGLDFMSHADLTASLDNLIAAGDIPDTVFVLIQTGDRTGEYPRGRRHARYVVGELLPAILQHYDISPQPADRVLLGASLGAVASLAVAFRYPGAFGGLVLNSGSFILDHAVLQERDQPVFQRVAHLVRAIRRAPDLPPTRAFVSTGELEGLAGENRALASFLRERGVDVLFQTAWDGHHWHNWRDQLRDGLMWVLGSDR